MADAAVSGNERVPEASRRAENSSSSIGGGGSSSSGLSGEESRAAVAEVEDSTQNGGRCERFRSDEEPLLGAAVAGEDRSSPGRGLHKMTVSAAHEQLQQPQLGDGLGASLSKASEDLPPKRNFQIPRKSREKKGCLRVIISLPPSLSFSPFLFGLHKVPPHTTACKAVSGAEGNGGSVLAGWFIKGVRLVEITTDLARKRLR